MKRTSWVSSIQTGHLDWAFPGYSRMSGKGFKLIQKPKISDEEGLIFPNAYHLSSRSDLRPAFGKARAVIYGSVSEWNEVGSTEKK